MNSSNKDIETLCSRIMSHGVQALKPKDPVSKAYTVMKDHGFHHMAICKDDGELVGVISLGDILLVASKNGDVVDVPDDTVDSIMSPNPVTCSRSHTTAQVADMMIQHKVSCLPVLSNRNKLIGIITSTDLLELMRKSADTQLLPNELFDPVAV